MVEPPKNEIYKKTIGKVEVTPNLLHNINQVIRLLTGILVIEPK